MLSDGQRRSKIIQSRYSHRNIKGSDKQILPVCLGTWVFGEGDNLKKRESAIEVMEFVISKGITLIDTAPIYGTGYSEKLIGDFLKKKIREDIIIATKLGLSIENSKCIPNLKKKRMLQEFDESRKRLSTDYIDLYQVHYPDPDVPIARVAETMYSFHQKGLIKAIGVSNFNISQIKKFLKYSPLHVLQTEYNMFKKDIEDKIIPFCVKNNIAILSYAPLSVGLLTGKFFFENKPLTIEAGQRINQVEFKEPRLSGNKDALSKLKDIAKKYDKTLTQLVINWTFSQKGITSCILGIRDLNQAKENLKSMDWSISKDDMGKIDKILTERQKKIKLPLMERIINNRIINNIKRRF